MVAQYLKRYKISLSQHMLIHHGSTLVYHVHPQAIHIMILTNNPHSQHRLAFNLSAFFLSAIACEFPILLLVDVQSIIGNVTSPLTTHSSHIVSFLKTRHILGFSLTRCDVFPISANFLLSSLSTYDLSSGSPHTSHFLFRATTKTITHHVSSHCPLTVLP